MFVLYAIRLMNETNIVDFYNQLMCYVVRVASYGKVWYNTQTRARAFAEKISLHI